MFARTQLLSNYCAGTLQAPGAGLSAEFLQEMFQTDEDLYPVYLTHDQILELGQLVRRSLPPDPTPEGVLLLGALYQIGQTLQAINEGEESLPVPAFGINCVLCEYDAQDLGDLLRHFYVDHLENVPDTGETFDVPASSEPDFGFAAGKAKLHNVHTPDKCAGQACVIHNPSNHRMREWRLHWRGDRGIMERMCPEHGVGHPDPDDMAYRRRAGLDDAEGTHGCCGCCFER